MKYKIYKKAKRLLLLLILLFFMAFIIISPEKYTEKCLFGIKLWAVTVLPTLLPFFFLTQLLTFTGAINGLTKTASKFTKPLFKLGGLSFYAFLMSVLSGYPVGSRIVYDLKCNGLITKNEATKISVLASTSGPLFIIGAVGIGMFSSKTIGFIVYISHVLSAIIMGLLFRNYGEENYVNSSVLKPKNQENILYNSIYNSVISVLIVGGFISIFYVFANILQDAKILYPLEKIFELIFSLFGGEKETSKAFILGLIECTSGAKMLSNLKNVTLSVSLSSALISFGGISIIMQSLIYLQKAEVKAKVFIFSKIIQAVISFIICYIILSFCL